MSHENKSLLDKCSAWCLTPNKPLVHGRLASVSLASRPSYNDNVVIYLCTYTAMVLLMQ